MRKLQGFFAVGMFFSEISILGIGYDPKIGERLLGQEAIQHTMFGGMLSKKEGNLMDHYGKSSIKIIKFDDNFLSFKKHYDNRRGPKIIYSFHKKKGEQWIGAWRSEDGLNAGLAHMVLVPIEEIKESIDFKKVQEGLSEFISEEEIPWTKQWFKKNRPDPVQNNQSDEEDLPF